MDGDSGRAGADDGERPDHVGRPQTEPPAVVRAPEDAARARASIEQACGVVMFLLGCAGEQARAALEQVSQDEGVELIALSRALLLDAARQGADPTTSAVEAVARAHWSGALQSRRVTPPTRGDATG